MDPTRTALLLLTILATISPGCAAATAQELRVTPDVPLIEASGWGEVRLSPERATVTLSVQTTGASAANVAAENSRAQQAVLDTLRALGFSGSQVSTTRYSVGPHYELEPGVGRRQEGYVAQNAVRVRVEQLDRIGGVIDAALAKGATGISNVSFEAATTEEARRQALAEAAESARAEAETIASAYGGTLGALLEATVNPARGSDMVLLRAAGRAETPISPSDIVVRAAVTGRWRFIPGR